MLLLPFWPLWLVVGASYEVAVEGEGVARGKRHPVVLLHGFAMNRTNWIWLGSRLAKRGIGPLYGTSYFSPQSVRRSAEHLSRFVDRVRAQRSVRPRRHRRALARRRGRALLRRAAGRSQEDRARLVTIGSPHKGTVIARLGRALPVGARDLPQQRLLRRARAPVAAERRGLHVGLVARPTRSSSRPSRRRSRLPARTACSTTSATCRSCCRPAFSIPSPNASRHEPLRQTARHHRRQGRRRAHHRRRGDGARLGAQGQARPPGADQVEGAPLVAVRRARRRHRAGAPARSAVGGQHDAASVAARVRRDGAALRVHRPPGAREQGVARLLARHPRARGLLDARQGLVPHDRARGRRAQVGSGDPRRAGDGPPHHDAADPAGDPRRRARGAADPPGAGGGRAVARSGARRRCRS